MGRHGSPDVTGGPAGADRLRTWAERAALAALASLTIVGVLRWAGAEWRTCLMMGGAVFVVVLVAALVAATVPPPVSTQSRSESDGPPTRNAPSQPARSPRPARPAAPHEEPPAPDPRTWPGGP
jgi:hypothetical protein